MLVAPTVALVHHDLLLQSQDKVRLDCLSSSRSGCKRGRMSLARLRWWHCWPQCWRARPPIARPLPSFKVRISILNGFLGWQL